MQFAKKYRVFSIQNKDGTVRTDGRYPLRIGRTLSFTSDPVTGKCLHFEWLQNADGTPYSGWFRTSLVDRIEQYADGTLIITTCNSIYTFTVVQDHRKE